MSNILVMLTLILATPLSFAPNAFAREASWDKATANIPRFREVTPAIFAGANPTSYTKGEQGLEALMEMRMSTVINLQGGDLDGTIAGSFSRMMQKGEHPLAIANERKYFEDRQVRFYNFPINSRSPKSEQEDQDIRKALQLMSEATPLFPLYIHCQHGADRTGLLIALYRVVYQGVDPIEAHREWVANGHGRVARWFTGQLDVYFYSFLAKEKARLEQTAAPSSECADDLLL